MSVPAYRFALRAAAGRTLRKPGELAVRLMFYVVILIVFAALWKVATADGPIHGYDDKALLWYVAMAEGAVIALKPRMIEDIGFDIAGGGISTEMLRPVSVLGFRLAAEFGESLVRLALAVVIGSAFAWVVSGPPHDPAAFALSLPAAVLAVMSNLAAQHAFAGVAFWLRDARAAWFLYQKMVFLFGGMLLPLQLFPPLLARISWVLPFWTMAYAPARLAAGYFEPWLLVAQAGWIVALLALAAAVFAAGERRLEVVGG